MRKILIFSGTTEGRQLARILSDNEIPSVVSVATEYGNEVMPVLPFVTVHQGRMDKEQMKTFVTENDFSMVVDATHPYATVVSENIRESIIDTQIPYLRLKRNTTLQENNQVGTVKYAETAEECVHLLEHTQGNILLTTGSKDLGIFCANKEVRERLYVRVLPSTESLKLCEQQSLYGKQIIAMQGPFTQEMNRALIRQFNIKGLVTKESGITGGFPEKLKAAKKEKIPVFVIGNPEKNTAGYSLHEICSRISALTGNIIKNRLDFIGVGMGTKETLTTAALKKIADAEYIFGAQRLLDMVESNGVKKPYYLAKDILPCLDEISGTGAGAVVLFSGDTGFYSGCLKLYDEVKKRSDCIVKIYPGISCVSYFAAATGYSWQDAAVFSIHGHSEKTEWKGELLDTISCHEKTFLLMSGAKDVRMLGYLLLDASLKECQVITGYQLSYPEQKICCLTPLECIKVEEEGLYLCLIINHDKKERRVCISTKDESFIREKVPMTKEEIRMLSVGKLALKENSVVYDIGSGTGSVACDIAKQSPRIRVYAVEKKAEAVKLITVNKDQFFLYNIEVISGEAPEALKNLPVPTHAFIGGSSKKLDDILNLLYEKNPQMNVVLNAVSLETTAQITKLSNDTRICELEVIQVLVNRARKIGNYQLMQAENPVYIASFKFQKED